MALNCKQENLKEIESMLPSVKLADLLQDLCNRYGQGTLADQIGMDPAAFSRFKNGDGNISLKHLEALFSEANITILPESDVKRLVMSFFTISDLWKKSMGW